MKKVLLLVVLGLVCLGLAAAPVSAACTASAQVYYSYVSGSTAYYILGGWPFTVNPSNQYYYYVVSTTSAPMMGQMNAAMARSGCVVTTTSNATSCPKTAGVINNWGGLTKAYIYPLY